MVNDLNMDKKEQEYLAVGSSQTIALPYSIIWVIWERENDD